MQTKPMLAIDDIKNLGYFAVISLYLAKFKYFALLLNYFKLLCVDST